MGIFNRIVGAYHGFRRKDSKALLQWHEQGLSVPPPDYVKRRLIENYIEHYGITRFIETGTYMGSMLRFVAKKGIRCTSIELSDDLFRAAQEKFSGFNNVELIHGDSGKVIPKVIKNLDEPALFWLDGHYSHGVTAQGEKDTPIAEELAEVLNHHIADHVILIDDVRCFTGQNDYPHLHDLLREIDANGKYQYLVHCDIIHLIPASNRASGYQPESLRRSA